jgi:ribonuclease R
MLSENLCSLKPDVPRLTVSVFIHFDEKGSLIDYRIARTVIKSAKRFTYREAKEVLDGKVKSKHEPLLHLMVELCGHLKLIRYDRGSIEFSLPDLIIKIDEKGVPTNVEYVAYDITHQMIEEFMLKANEIVALHLSKAGKGVAYRIHDEPSDDNMKDFVALANAFGFTLNDPPSARELQEFFYEALQTPYGEYLATSFIRRMRQAL